ncbi:kinesin-like protein KIF14 isoform X2 [Clavelina lepadiformis]|uniref:kinesin-like protein KIF14 isoform X2 n=1 Tax=Clavelina lepadiformis TaxID=159417 RepID=UPI004041F4A1
MSKLNSKGKYPTPEHKMQKTVKLPQTKSTISSFVDSAIDKENNNHLQKPYLTAKAASSGPKRLQFSSTTIKEQRSNKTDSKNDRTAKDEKTKKTPVSVSGSSNMANGSNTQKKPATPKSRTSVAATFLGKTADGLASSPKKPHILDHSRILKLEQTSTTRKNLTSQGVGSQRILPTTPIKAKKTTTPVTKQHDILAEPNRGKHFIDKRGFNPNGVASPTVAKIPNDIVRNMVNNIQAPLGSTKKETERAGHIRKSLAGVFEQRTSLAQKRKSYLPIPDEEIAAEDFSVTVAVRVRPFSQREIGLEAKQVVYMDGNETVVNDGNTEHSFVYDYSFWSADHGTDNFASQNLVYKKLAEPLLHAVFEGYNTCLFAYGQTGSGKSYTIMGLGDDKGVVPRFCEQLFSSIQQRKNEINNVHYHVQVGYFEIYNEKIHDLLVSSQPSADGSVTKQVLRVREHPELGPYVEGLSKFSVSSFADVQAWLEVGNRQRATASTGMNDKSSRSHSVFTMSLVQTTTEDLEGEKHESSRRSQVNLVDLAGSERSSTAGTSGQRLKEGASINKSLLTLGKVISALSERTALPLKRKKRMFIPYRDSTLTWILRESLGGNSRTAMIATISPASCHMDETLSTLRYAKQARTIVNLVKVNEDPNAKIIRELKAEIAKLKERYGQNEIDPDEFKASLQEVSSLRQQLCTAERERDEVQEQWKRKLEQSEKRKAEEINELKRAGVSFKVDNQLPNLVNLNEDPQLSELLLYMIKHGVTRVGKKGGDCDIQLSGALIANFHCKIFNVDEVVTIEPIGDAKTFVNGESITGAVTLHHADRVVIGGDHFFRLNNPIEVQRSGSRKRNSGGKRKDFEFAKHELIERQNERIQAEIEEAQIKVKREMMGEIEAAKHEAEQQISSQRNEYELAIQNLQAQLVKDKAAKQELETICEQAEVIQKEFKISRRNRHVESSLEKGDFDADQIKTNVLASLEAERQKLAKEVERMQRRRACIKSKPSHGSSTLRLSLLLEEANNIAKSLNKHTTFSRYDASDEQLDVMIRVYNTKLGIWTLWSLNKFENKLELMREAYNGDANSSSEDGEEVGNIFYDPADEWQEAYNECPDTPTSSRGNQRTSRRLTRRLSSLVLARASPALQQSLSQLTSEKYSPGSRQYVPDTAQHIAFCKMRINASVEIVSNRCNSVIDRLLMTLNSISKISTKILQSFEEKDDYSASAAFYEQSTAITMATEMMLTVVSFIRQGSLEVAESSTSITKLIHQTEKASKKLAGHVSKLLHGCHSDIEKMVKESSSKISHVIPNMSKYAGAIAIATNITVSLFNETNQQELSHRMKHAFLQGGDTFMRKILSGGIEKMEVLEQRQAASVRTSFLGGLYEAVVKLLQTCLDLQQELYDASLIVHERDVPAHYYGEYLQRTQNLIQEVSNLVEGVAVLNEKAIEYPDSPNTMEEIRYKAELLWRPTSRIGDLCVKHEGLCAIMHDVKSRRMSSNINSNNSNNNVDVTKELLSDRLCDSVFTAGRALQEILREIIDFADSSTTSEDNSAYSDIGLRKSSDNDPFNIDEKSIRTKRRLLPTSPALLNSNESLPVTSTSFVVKSVVTKWLKLADSPKKLPNEDTIISKSVYV